jgi:hypothetical protein
MTGGWTATRPTALEGEIIHGPLDDGPVEIQIWDHPIWTELVEEFGDPIAEARRAEEALARYFHVFDQALKISKPKELTA